MNPQRAKRLLPELAGESLIGSTISSCTVDSLLGQGPISDCYSADCGGHKVCVKVIADQSLTEETDRQEFLERVDAVTQRLSHPNAVTPISHGRMADGLYHIVTPYENEVSVRRLLRTHGLFTERTALRAAQLMLKALEHAHTFGITHGNLKPPNVVFSRRRGTLIVDWASPPVAHLACRGRLRVADERKVVDVGAGYLAPELLHGENLVMPSADMFSVGAILFYMLTGREPALGAPAQVLERWETSGFPSIEREDVLLSDRTVRLVRRLTEPKPQERYWGVAEVWRDVNMALGPSSRA